MTAKDAVKCERFADSHDWYLDVEAKPDLRLGERLLSLLEEYKRG
jgi:tetraacyldisaccharide-1-P 4'-kinase